MQDARLELLHTAEGQIHTLSENVQALQRRLEQIERTTVWRIYRRLAREA